MYCEIIDVIFEKLIKNTIMDTLQGTMSHFQNGGMRGKGVVDNLFILRGIIDHANNSELHFMILRSALIIYG